MKVLLTSYRYELTNSGVEKMTEEENSLVVVWSSGDREVALKVVFMYTLNSKLRNWWEDVRLIVWGPSAKLMSTDIELQEYLQKMREAGVILEACKSCADLFGVSGKLEELGFDVKLMGVPLTTYLKEGRNIITF